MPFNRPVTFKNQNAQRNKNAIKLVGINFPEFLLFICPPFFRKRCDMKLIHFDYKIVYNFNYSVCQVFFLI